MTTLECVDGDAGIEDGSHVQAIAENLVEVFRSAHCPDLVQGVHNVVEALDPDRAKVALLGYYARVAETEVRRFS